MYKFNPSRNRVNLTRIRMHRSNAIIAGLYCWNYNPVYQQWMGVRLRDVCECVNIWNVVCKTRDCNASKEDICDCLELGGMLRAGGQHCTMSTAPVRTCHDMGLPQVKLYFAPWHTKQFKRNYWPLSSIPYTIAPQNKSVEMFSLTSSWSRSNCWEW